MKIQHLSFVGIDYWGRATFRHAETKNYYCFVDMLYDEDEQQRPISDLMQQNYILYSKGLYFDGEPGYPVNYTV